MLHHEVAGGKSFVVGPKLGWLSSALFGFLFSARDLESVFKALASADTGVVKSGFNHASFSSLVNKKVG